AYRIQPDDAGIVRRIRVLIASGGPGGTDFSRLAGPAGQADRPPIPVPALLTGGPEADLLFAGKKSLASFLKAARVSLPLSVPPGPP
ncbi:MAG TPA: hypothetical protein VMC79_08875, partial [Rectinemataceae bacterium]|nr:hypothetical protein [Rectinemataceae bacterium]